MKPSYKRWSVSGYQRPQLDRDRQEWFDTGARELVVIVDDPHGWAWELVVEKGQLLSVGVRPHPGTPLDQHLLSRAPLGYLRDVATTYEADVSRSYDEGMHLDDAFAEGERKSGEVRRPKDTPTSREFAAAWLALPDVVSISDGERLTRRTALHEKFGVSVWAVDKWTRAARDAGLIPPAREGSKEKS